MQIGGQRFLEHGGINVVVVNFKPYLQVLDGGERNREGFPRPC
jgi:hypothetical protein